jgi:subtilase-type serine protease
LASAADYINETLGNHTATSVVAAHSLCELFYSGLRMSKPIIHTAMLAVALTASLPISAAHAQIDSRLWGLSMVGADKAWELGYRGNGVIIGVMDQSADPLHTEYADRWLGGMNIDGTPYVLNPTHDHGTHVTGTIAGRRVGVAPGADIYNVNWAIAGVPIDNVANGYYWVAGNGVRAINNSWGLNRFDAALNKQRGITVTDVDANHVQINFPNMLSSFSALAQSDVVQIFATGNDRVLDYGAGGIRHTLQPGILAGLPAFFPELTTHWIAVTAVGPTGDYGSYAQPCGLARQWCMAAPGGSGVAPAEDQIFSSMVSYEYGWLNGTSMATPHVTGAFAIGAEMFPNASGAQIAQLLLQTSKDIGAPGIDDNYGWGLLSVANMAATIAPATASVFSNAGWARANAFNAVDRVLRNQMGQPLGLRSATGDIVPLGYMPTADATPTPFDAVLQEPAGPILWLAPVYGIASISDGAASAASTIGGVLAGVDLVHDKEVQFGLALGYSHTALTSNNDGGSANAFHLGAYGNWSRDNWFVNGTGQVSLFEQGIERRDISGASGISFAPVGRSSASGIGLGASFEVGHHFRLNDDFTVSPYLALAAQVQAIQAASEIGAGIFGLDIAGGKFARMEAGPGLRIQSAPFNLEGGHSLRLTGDIGYARVAGENDYAVATDLLGRTITGQSVELGRDVLKLGAKLDLTTANGDTWFAAYDGSLQRSASAHAVSIGFQG